MRLLASLCPMPWRWWNKGRHLNPNSMAVAGLSCRKAMVSTGRAVSVLFGINELRNKLAVSPCRAYISISSIQGQLFSYPE